MICTRNIASVLCVAIVFLSKLLWADPLNVEAGAEVDTNIHRTETVNGLRNGLPIRSAPLLKFGIRKGVVKKAWGGTVVGQAYGGAKLFLTQEGQRENVGIVSVDLRYQHAIEKGSRATLFGQGTYYDAFGLAQLNETDTFSGRNFRMAGVQGGSLVVPMQEAAFGVYAGFQAFQFKPDDNFNWQGSQVGVRFRGTMWSSGKDDADENLTLSLNYEVGRRLYNGYAITNTCGGEEPAPGCLLMANHNRVDIAHNASVTLSYLGNRIYDFRYVLAVNDTNSFGFGQTRHRFELGMTTELWYAFYLTARGTIRWNQFHDNLRLAPDVQSQTFVTIEEENRNSISLLLSRDLTKSLGLEARYALYSNEIASDTLRFRRQTMYLGMTYRFSE